MSMYAAAAVGSILFFGLATMAFLALEKRWQRVSVVVAALLFVVAAFFSAHWYHTQSVDGVNETASFRADAAGCSQRTVNVYAANGDLLAAYCGDIRLYIGSNGLVWFYYDGKEYKYVNCFIESVAELP